MAQIEAGSSKQILPGGSPEGREEDRIAIHAALEQFAKAFESRDPQALAPLWTTGGEYRNEEGRKIEGRNSIAKHFAGVFATSPVLKATVEAESIRFLSRDSAIEEGTVSVRRGVASPLTNAHYQVLLVREDGRWLIARMEESPGPGESIEDLDWLVGAWKSATGQGAEIQTTYSWSPSKKFLNASFSIKEKERALSGLQVIGVDPSTGALHSWMFEADGGVGEAEWTRDGDHWVLEANGSLTDGRTLTQTNILRRINQDTFTWQSVDRRLDDAPLQDLPPVKVTRIKPAG